MQTDRLQEANGLAGLYEKIQHQGTPEMAYTDAGLWNYLPYVKTKDSHKKKNPVAPLPVAQKDYLKILFLFMLCFDKLLVPKSRQMMVSWALSAYDVWHSMTAPYRLVVYQTKKESDSHAMVTEGRKNPAGGRMDFIIQNLPGWLQDDHITSGAGNLVGNLVFSPDKFNEDGEYIPWYGSRIEAVPGGPDQVRGKTASKVSVDEGAFHDALKKVITAVNQAIADGGQLHVVSSVDSGSDFNSLVLNTTDGSPPEHKVPEIIEKALKIMGIRWPRGLRAWETADGFQVLELHYTADPAKDPDRQGTKWVQQCVKGYPGGMEGAGWKTEMEIDYAAGGGEKMFPFLSQSLSPVFIDKIDPEWAMARMNIFAGYDYGTNNPSAFVVSGIDDKGDLYALWELYEPCIDYIQHCNKIKACPYFPHLEFIAADNKMFSKTQQTADGVKAVSELFVSQGIPISRARQGMDYPVAMRLLSEYWPGGLLGFDKIPPRAFVTADCPNGKIELRGIRKAEHKSDSVSRDKNAPEKLVDKDNHWFDAWCYSIDKHPGLFVRNASLEPKDSINAFIARAEATIPKVRRVSNGIHCA